MKLLKFMIALFIGAPGTILAVALIIYTSIAAAGLIVGISHASHWTQDSWGGLHVGGMLLLEVFAGMAGLDAYWLWTLKSMDALPKNSLIRMAIFLILGCMALLWPMHLLDGVSVFLTWYLNFACMIAVLILLDVCARLFMLWRSSSVESER